MLFLALLLGVVDALWLLRQPRPVAPQSTVLLAAGSSGVFTNSTMSVAPAALWNANVSFNDTSWSAMSLPIGYDNNSTEIFYATPFRFFGSLYLRMKFNVSAAQLAKALEFGSLSVAFAADDRASLWLNGVSLINPPTGNRDFLYWQQLLTVNASMLREGVNLFAATVVNAGTTSSDAFFDAQITLNDDVLPAEGAYSWITPVPTAPWTGPNVTGAWQLRTDRIGYGGNDSVFNVPPMAMVASAAVRRVFNVTSARLAQFNRFDLRIIVEGNATVYLNGVVVSPAVAPATARYFNAIVANITLLNGTNVLAAEVYSLNSQSMLLSMSITGVVEPPTTTTVTTSSSLTASSTSSSTSSSTASSTSTTTTVTSSSSSSTSSSSVPTTVASSTSTDGSQLSSSSTSSSSATATSTSSVSTMSSTAGNETSTASPTSLSSQTTLDSLSSQTTLDSLSSSTTTESSTDAMSTTETPATATDNGSTTASDGDSSLTTSTPTTTMVDFLIPGLPLETWLVGVIAGIIFLCCCVVVVVIVCLLCRDDDDGDENDVPLPESFIRQDESSVELRDIEAYVQEPTVSSVGEEQSSRSYQPLPRNPGTESAVVPDYLNED